MKLSACVITKNEADTIGKCLTSLQDIVDEIIVVDTGSNDDTAAIAKQHNAKVYFYEWKNDFASAKNFALDQATGDWIVFLDADEYFSAETSQNVKRIIQDHEHECEGLMIKLINIDVDNDNQYIDEFFKLRIFKKDKDMRFVGKVHEEIHNLTGRRNRYYQVDAKELIIYHTGYSTNKIKGKCKRNLSILLKQLNGTKRDEEIYGYLADVYYGLQEYEQAIHYAELDIASDRKELTYASRPYRILINSLSREKENKDKLENSIIQAIHAFPDLPDFYFEYALVKYIGTLYDEALGLLLKAIQLHESYDNIETSLFKRDLKLAYSLAAKIYEKKNLITDAIGFYQQALNVDKYDTESFHALFKLIDRQDIADSIDRLNRLYDTTKLKDVKFLILHISAIRKGKILLHYLEVYKVLVNNKNTEILDLIAASKYNEVTEKMRSNLIIDVNFLALSAILLDNQSSLTEDIEYLPEKYKRVIWRYYHINDVKLTKNEFEVYKAILLGLRRANKEEVLMRYCECVVDFAIYDILEIADLLKYNRCYVEAIALYEYILGDKNTENLDEIYYSLGYCYYRNGQVEKAKLNFEQAVRMGNSNNEVHAFLKWSKIFL